MRMSQMAASVESRGINLIQSRLFLKACSSVGHTRNGQRDLVSSLLTACSFYHPLKELFDE